MKLPVFKAFSAGLAYFVTHILDVIRLAWLPALLLTAVTAYITPLYLESMTELMTIDPNASQEEVMAALSTMGDGYQWMGLLYVAMAIFYPMLIAGGLKHIIRGEGRLPFYLQFGGDEFRVLIAYVLFIIMTILVTVVAFLAMMVLGIVAGVISQEIGGIVFAIAMLALVVAFFWFILRLSLLFPATIDTKDIAFGRSWRLTKGNSWRLFFYFFLWMLIMMVIGGIFVLLMMPGYFGVIGEMIAAGADEAAQQEISRKMMEIQIGMWDMSTLSGIVTVAGAFVFTIFNIAFWNISTGIAYRYLSEEG